MTEPMPPIEQRTRDNIATERVYLPRITIKYCTQCKWMLRAAYFAQELLSTFNTDLGEVALIPSTGGIFTVTMYHSSSSPDDAIATAETVIWDRKMNGGFPEVKHLKSLVRNVIDPSRDLGHTDRALRAANVPTQTQTQTQTRTESGASQDVNPRAAVRGKEENCEECQ